MALNRNGTALGEEPERDPALERIYALGEREEPPARLDDAIRAAARREVGARPTLPGKTWSAWRVPVSLAAVLVLSVSVVILMREEGADRLEEVAPATTPPVESAPPAQPAEPPAKRELMERAKPAREAASRDAPVLRTAPAAEEDRIPKEQTKAKADAAQPAAAPGPATQPFAEQQAAPSESRASAPPAPAARSPAGALAKETELGAAAGSAVRPRAAAASQAAPEAREPAADLATQAKPFMEKRQRSENAAEASRPIWSGYERQPPEKWIARIEELRRAGNDAGARDMLEEFRRRFPEHPLPAALAR